MINMDVLQEICFQFRVPLEQDMLEMLIRWCKVEDDPTLVHYPLFIQYTNWKNNTPSDKLNSTTIGSIPSLQLANKLANVTLVQESSLNKSTIATADGRDSADVTAAVVADKVATSPVHGDNDMKQTANQAPLTAAHYRTSSQTIGATVGNISNINYPTCGVPTIRSDKAAPRIKRVSDNTVSILTIDSI